MPPPQGVNSGESLGLGCRSSAKSACMCAVVVAIDRFSAFGAAAQPANSSVKKATTVSLTALPLSILFFMNPFICLILPPQHRVYSHSL
jgi:hypothetical protein